MIDEKILEKFKSIKTNYDIDTLVRDFLSFLQGRKFQPLDIINAKIDIIDTINVPFQVWDINTTQQITADIGKDNTILEEEETGTIKVEYKNGCRYETPEKKSVFKTSTTWSRESFEVNVKKRVVICLREELSRFFDKDKMNKINFSDEFLDGRTLAYMIAATENIHEFYHFIPPNYTPEASDLIGKVVGEQVAAELNKKGDHSKNVEIIQKNNDTKFWMYYVPVGYIKYNYGTNNEDYYFVESLNDKSVFYSSIPVDSAFKEKNKQGLGICFFFAILYIGLIFYAYKLVFSIDLHNIGYVFYVIAAILFFDWCSIYTCYSENCDKNTNKHHNYIAKLFLENYEELKRLIINLDKPYKE